MMTHKWTEEDTDIVRRDYRGTTRSAESIASNLGVTLCAVKGQVQRLGVAMQKSPPWKPEEIERLSELVHQHSITVVAKMLHRSANAVKIKATRLKMCLRTRDGWFTKKEVCEILGVDHKWVQARIDSEALKASWHNGKRPQKNGMSYWHILEADLRRYIIRHSHELLGRNVDIQQITWILVGAAK